ncbi:Xylose isomerase-like TIM barrel [Maioricimonas rarisocia]|uniref:Xylose isomerase-like TIM barrel n=1 Tax=Maioricimonas rarisocia TaxID=2528026 RepID=A0A517ZCQ5_9PLAN|nr:metabolite traffic protein EboE [Maioricimonas rarisocia]QDU40278.1 Xylose isomerase-like TIM barrel [Maioricimonas rarisocia]
MSLSTLPLSYCTNVHPGQTVDQVIAGLEQYTVPMSRQVAGPVAAGLWLAQPVIAELEAQPAGLEKLRQLLGAHGLSCYTLNAFPYGDFHSERVKENVYIPDWSAPDRLDYTSECADVLARLMPEGCEGSISTVPLGFKELPHQPDFVDRCIDNLLSLADRLDQIHDETGRVIRLAIEPEPFCELETTPETIAFFEQMFERAESARMLDVARRHLGVCYDVCHQAVEFEDVAGSIAELQAADIRINKVHITCAIQLAAPGEDADARAALARYVEPRYLHQTMARTSDGTVHRIVDLTTQACLEPPQEFLDAEMWRIHFHVPVNAESLGPLQTTRGELVQALTAIQSLEYAPHLEVETYTWEVLPEGNQQNLVDGLAAELTATQQLLSGLQNDFS